MPAPAPSPKPSDKGNLKEWVKNHLQALGHALANLAHWLYCLSAPKYLRKDYKLACGEFVGLGHCCGNPISRGSSRLATLLSPPKNQSATRPSVIPPVTRASFSSSWGLAFTCCSACARSSAACCDATRVTFSACGV